MRTTNYYPVIASADVAGTVAFYTRHFPFVPVFETDWYVHLAWRDDPRTNLAVVDHQHPSIPPAHRVPGAGVILTFEVDDADTEYQRLRDESVDVVTDLVDEPWGQRHFIVQDPNHLLIDIVQPIAPTAEYAESYKDGAAAEGIR